MSILDGLRDGLLLPTEAFGDGFDEWHNAVQESNHQRNIQTLVVIDKVREALTSDKTAKAAAEVLCNTVCTCSRAGDDALGFLCCECDARAVLAFLAEVDQ